MENDLFWKATRLLTHPASELALAALLLNDHLLRRLWPSWFTGKLGDFAWLFFMPFVTAAVIALVAGRRAGAHRRAIGLIACLFIGGAFALAKTLPAAHAAVVGAASALFGFPVGWRRDPTDLIALLSVFAAWRLWDADERRRAQKPADRASGRTAVRAIPLLALAGLLTIANSPAPEAGITVVAPQGGALLACSTYGAFLSSDGGMTWAALVEPTPIPHPTLPRGVTPTAGPTPTPIPTPTLQPGAPTPLPYQWKNLCHNWEWRNDLEASGVLARWEKPDAWPTPEPTPAPGEPTPTPAPTATPPLMILQAPTSGEQYRFRADGAIERSVDGGRTWTAEHTMKPLTAAERRQLVPYQFYGSSRSYQPGPVNGVIDPVTGNVVFSMGLQGVLVRDTTGQYWWIPVGDFHRPFGPEQ